MGLWSLRPDLHRRSSAVDAQHTWGPSVKFLAGLAVEPTRGAVELSSFRRDPSAVVASIPRSERSSPNISPPSLRRTSRARRQVDPHLGLRATSRASARLRFTRPPSTRCARFRESDPRYESPYRRPYDIAPPVPSSVHDACTCARSSSNGATRYSYASRELLRRSPPRLERWASSRSGPVVHEHITRPKSRAGGRGGRARPSRRLPRDQHANHVRIVEIGRGLAHETSARLAATHPGAGGIGTPQTAHRTRPLPVDDATLPLNKGRGAGGSSGLVGGSDLGFFCPGEPSGYI